MSLPRSLTFVVAATLAMSAVAAPRVAAQQSPAVTPVAAPITPATAPGTGPNGATLRCRDGSYPAANAPDSACDGKGGVAVRFPARREAPAPALRAVAPTATSTAAPANARAAVTDSLMIPEGFVSHAQRRAATDTMKPPPANATLLCANGTYIVSDTVAARCQAHGGLRLRLEAAKRP